LPTRNLYKRVVDRKLTTPDTWEVELSASGDKLASWTRLLAEDKLGALALLRNLRNMMEAGVDDAAIRKALTALKPERVLPFRFIAAARYAPLRARAGGSDAALAGIAGEDERAIPPAGGRVRLDG
jgi:hypothetical protein